MYDSVYQLAQIIRHSHTGVVHYIRPGLVDLNNCRVVVELLWSCCGIVVVLL